MRRENIQYIKNFIENMSTFEVLRANIENARLLLVNFLLRELCLAHPNIKYYNM